MEEERGMIPERMGWIEGRTAMDRRAKGYVLSRGLPQQAVSTPTGKRFPLQRRAHRRGDACDTVPARHGKARMSR